VDPVNHGLVGIAAGLSILTARRPKASWQTQLVVALCGLGAGEVPDADRIFDAVMHPYDPEGQGLAYMLYHRGPLHTLIFCLLAALTLALLFRFVARKWAPPLGLLFAVALVGSCLHLAMDGMNDYGVHPFCPWSQRWFYGDFLFLAEPTVGAALLPYVFVAFGSQLEADTARRAARAAGVGVLAFILLLVAHQWLKLFGAVVASLWLFLQAFLQRRGPRPLIAWASLGLALACFFATSRFARARALDWISGGTERSSSPDVVTTPAPANPFCWRVITVERRGDAFRVQLGITSLWPSLVQTGDCFAPPGGPVPRAACGVALPPEITKQTAKDKIWKLAEFSGRVSEFEQMAKDNPRVGATRHFLRAPFWGPDARGGASDCPEACRPRRTLIGDMRVDYDRDDLGEYCKYSFLPKKREPYEQLMPVGDPPFFR
jgi:inner membrane protein